MKSLVNTGPGFRWYKSIHVPYYSLKKMVTCVNSKAKAFCVLTSTREGLKQIWVE